MPTSVEAWFTRRTYDGARFADPVALARRERDLGLSVSILLPCLQTPAALGEMVGGIRALDKRAQLIDQIASTGCWDPSCPSPR